MKRITLIAGMASVATVAAVMWSVPASAITCGSSACAVVHNRWPGRPIQTNKITQPSAETPAQTEQTNVEEISAPGEMDKTA